MGIQVLNTYKNGVIPKKQAWVSKRKTPARRELDPKNANRMLRGYTSVKHLQEGNQTQKASKQNVYMGIQA